MISAKNHDAEIDEAVWWPNFFHRNGMLIIFYLTECAGSVLKFCSIVIHQDNVTIIRYHLIRNSMKSVQSSEMIQFGTNRPAAIVQSDVE
jgi:hypothetical protein